MFKGVWRDIIGLSTLLIGLTALGNAIANPSGTAALGKTVISFITEPARSLRR